MRIKDSWEKIRKSVYDGSYRDKYKVGDTKPLNGTIMAVKDVKLKGLNGPFLSFKSTEKGDDFEVSFF